MYFYHIRFKKEKKEHISFVPCKKKKKLFKPRSFAPLHKSHRNHRSLVWTETLSDMVSVPTQELSGIVLD